MSVNQSAQATLDKSYFDRLTRSLTEFNRAQPTLVIDKDALDRNIERLKQVIECGYQYRLVVKSLPCVDLIRYVLSQTNSKRLMCFHLPFLKLMVESFPEADILLGKPMTKIGLETTLVWLKRKQAADYSIQWLVDSQARLEDYAQIAERQGLTVKINLEIDIGLGRGGFKELKSLEKALQFIQNSDQLNFSGLMGYEAHASKIPKVLGGPEAALAKAKQAYKSFKSLAQEYFPDETLCFNSGGSTTLTHYQTQDEQAIDPSGANELSLGSALVKPSDFDLPSLSEFEPSMFIASPVLKVIDKTTLPGPRLASLISRTIGIVPQQAACIYGGNWLADPVYPLGFERIKAFGHSSNQEMYALPKSTEIKTDDWAFFRPKQSEALMLQFGNIAFISPAGSISWCSALNADEALSLEHGFRGETRP